MRMIRRIKIIKKSMNDRIKPKWAREDLPAILAGFRRLGRRPPLAVLLANSSSHRAAGFKFSRSAHRCAASQWAREDLNLHRIAPTRP